MNEMVPCALLMTEPELFFFERAQTAEAEALSATSKFFR
jgi:hypothetical protein